MASLLDLISLAVSPSTPHAVDIDNWLISLWTLSYSISLRLNDVRGSLSVQRGLALLFISALNFSPIVGKSSFMMSAICVWSLMSSILVVPIFLLFVGYNSLSTLQVLFMSPLHSLRVSWIYYVFRILFMRATLLMHSRFHAALYCVGRLLWILHQCCFSSTPREMDEYDIGMNGYE